MTSAGFSRHQGTQTRTNFSKLTSIKTAWWMSCLSAILPLMHWQRVSARITLWQKDKAFNDKRYEANPRDEAVEAPSKTPRHDENSRKAPILAAVSHKDDRCNCCGHTGHIRRNCRYSKFPDFNAEGPWEGSETYKKIEARMHKEGTPDEYPVLPRH